MTQYLLKLDEEILRLLKLVECWFRLNDVEEKPSVEEVKESF